MNREDNERERFGPALRIAALAATVLALAAVIGPRLASSGGGGGPSATSAPGAPVDAPDATSTSTTSTTTATTTAAATAATTSTSAGSDAAVITTTSNPPAATPTTQGTATPTPGVDRGAVGVSLIGTHLGRFGPERTGFFSGETVAWHFRVTNVGEEYLWGVYLFLEFHGPVTCGDRRLEVGESTDCWAETTALAGGNEAEAWVTAWTSTRMVTDRGSFRVQVLAA